MANQNQTNNLRRALKRGKKWGKFEDETDYDTDSDSAYHNKQPNDQQPKPVWPRFLLIESTDPDRPLTTLNPFAIDKAIQGLAGVPENIKMLKSSAQLLIECKKESQSNNLLKSKIFANIPIKVVPHVSLNSSKGVIRTREFDGVSDEVMLEGLKKQCVTAVKRITIRKDGKIIQTSTFIITFNKPTLPKEILAAYILIKVDPYIPNPLRCFKCQRFGHHQERCKQQPRCARCGQEGHIDSACTNKTKCCNCDGDHPAFSRECPQWTREKEIQHVRVSNKISFPEARKIVEARTPTAGQSYAAVAKVVQSKPSMVSIACQTDITWPENESCSKSLPPTTTQTSTTTKPISVSSSSQTITSPESVSLSESSPANNNTLSSSQNTKTVKINRNRKKSNPPATDRQKKGSNDLVQVHNRFGDLMDTQDAPMTQSERKSRSPKKKNTASSSRPS